jgi:ATP synthase protein I
MVGPPGGRQLNALARLASVGIEFSVSTVIGLLGGKWVDGKLGTQPWLMLLGLVLGVTAGLRSLLRTARRANQESAAKRDDTDDQT